MKTALLFPGQGSQSLKMIPSAKSLNSFYRYYQETCDLLRTDLFKTIETDPNRINSNRLSSAMTILLSALHLDQFLETHPRPNYFAGYSVGQWTALYAAGGITFSDLIIITSARAEFMDQCMKNIHSGMLAVIGLDLDDIIRICQEMREQQHSLWISNYNAPGQVSLAGTAHALSMVESKLSALGAKKIIHVPVAGAWHSPFLLSASTHFLKFLERYQILLDTNIVINNVDGKFLPTEKSDLHQALANQISSPVMWEQGINTLINLHSTNFYEIGFGNMLTKYGFFINRKLNFIPGLN